jgi:hypothetical protein
MDNQGLGGVDAVKADKGSCRACGWLAMRVRRAGGTREHLGVFEVESDDPEQPGQFFDISPGEANARKAGELTCYKGVHDLQKEMVTAGGPAHARAVQDEHYARAGAAAAKTVIWKDRGCPTWMAYEPGLSPKELVQELCNRAAVEIEDRRQARHHESDRRLTLAAAVLATIIGVAQIIAAVLTMTRDSIAYTWLRAVSDNCYAAWTAVLHLPRGLLS